ncbi:hypothetical protein BC835DRAFT_1359933 [Cytidiella melzeri]|nr:hypothetical protein BC835DRAFT_1359933 [Cytidiella melzeri]
MFPSPSSQTSLYSSLGFPDVPVSFHSQHTPFGGSADHQQQHSGGGVGDPNSPEVFKQNVNVIQQQLVRVQDLARSALMGIENAYHPGNNPVQTSDYLVALRQALHLLADLLRQSGVGALPMLDPSTPLESLPSEEKLLAETMRSIEVQYAQQKRIQESAGTVFNLLGSVDQAVRRA